MPALPTDLCALSDVESFLGLVPGNADESRLLNLIHALSSYLVDICNREFALQYISELRNGTGQAEMLVLQSPIAQLYGIAFTGSNVTLAATDLASGIVWDTNKVMIRGGVTVAGTMPYYSQGRFPLGARNIRINYLSGWQLPNQGVDDWQASTDYYPRATIQPSLNNPGNYIFSYQARRSGDPATSGASAPTFMQSAGNLTVDGDVIWTNLGVTAMPDALPYHFREACTEIVATRYRQQPRWADTSAGVGPERITFFTGDASASTKAIIQAMSNNSPILP